VHVRLKWVCIGFYDGFRAVEAGKGQAAIDSRYGRSELHHEFEEDRRQQWPLPIA